MDHKLRAHKLSAADGLLGAQCPPSLDQFASCRNLGFAAPSKFGGVIPIRAPDRIANAGLRYTQFQSSA
jgi:hypothetical protein